MERRRIEQKDALELLKRQESHFWDVKSARSNGRVVQKVACAMANADGGEFAIGVEDARSSTGLARWQGLSSMEDYNFVLEGVARDLKPAAPYSVEFLELEGSPEQGLVCLVTIRKSESVHSTSEGKVYVRRNASTMEIKDQDIVNLSLAKGARSYEDQILADYHLDDAVEEPELEHFLAGLSPAMKAEDFLRKQRLYDRESKAMRVSSAVLFAESPAAVVPKRCSIKIARYGTKVEKPTRDHLLSTPVSVEGPARVVIEESLRLVSEMIESVSVLSPDGALTPLKYPPEALKEVVVNAVIHRDYNLSDDVLISVFDNRVEVRSPGVLPGHMTLDNLLSDRFSRNPTIVRLLNKYPDPPNKDIGEGLRTAVDSMKKAKLQPPKFHLEGNYFIAIIGHTPLARPQEIVMQYLETHAEINNRIGRELTGITSENAMKDVFYGLRTAGKLERVPDRRGTKSAWRKVVPSSPVSEAEQTQPALLVEMESTTSDLGLPPYPDGADATTEAIVDTGLSAALATATRGQRLQPRRLTRAERRRRRS